MTDIPLVSGQSSAIAAARVAGAAPPRPLAPPIGPSGGRRSVDVLGELQALGGTETRPVTPTISESLFALIRPPALNAGLLQPSRLMTLLDIAIGALESNDTDSRHSPIDMNSVGVAALIAELGHHRDIARRRAEDFDDAR